MLELQMNFSQQYSPKLQLRMIIMKQARGVGEYEITFCILEFHSISENVQVNI